MSRNRLDERIRAARAASTHFTRAAAALTELPVTPAAVAFALLEGSMGLIKVAECDGDERRGESMAVASLRRHMQLAETEPSR